MVNITTAVSSLSFWYLFRQQDAQAMRWVTSRKLSRDFPHSMMYLYEVWNKKNEPKSGKEMRRGERERERERQESQLRKASLAEAERWETSNDHYQTGHDEMNDSDATSVASLCLTLSNSLKVLRLGVYKATSAWVPPFAAVVTQCVLLQRLELYCMSSNYFLILFFPSFLLLPMLHHFLALMKYNAGDASKTQDKDVASLFQALRRNKSITYLNISNGKYGWKFYYNCVLLNLLLCDCCSFITN